MPHSAEQINDKYESNRLLFVVLDNCKAALSHCLVENGSTNDEIHAERRGGIVLRASAFETGQSELELAEHILNQLFELTIKTLTIENTQGSVGEVFHVTIEDQSLRNFLLTKTILGQKIQERCDHNRESGIIEISTEDISQWCNDTVTTLERDNETIYIQEDIHQRTVAEQDELMDEVETERDELQLELKKEKEDNKRLRSNFNWTMGLIGITGLGLGLALLYKDPNVRKACSNTSSTLANAWWTLSSSVFGNTALPIKSNQSIPATTTSTTAKQITNTKPVNSSLTFWSSLPKDSAGPFTAAAIVTGLITALKFVKK